METATTATINTCSHRTIDLLLIGAKDPSKEYCNHYCPHNNTTYKNVCDGDGCIDPTSGWKQNSSVYPWSKVSRTTKNRRIDEYVKEQYALAGIPLASATISSPAPAAGSDSNAAAAAPASSGSGLALATVPGAVVDAGANTGSGANDGLLAALLASGWQLVHLPSGPAGAGQYLLDPTSGASFPVEGGIGFGPHAGAGAGAGAMPSTPTAASTPSRGGLGAAAAAGGGGAAPGAGSGARDGVHHPAGAGQYLLHPTNGASFPVKDGNAFFSGHGIGFGPHAGTAGAGAMPSTPAAASTPSRGGLGGGGTAAGAATAAAGSGARDGVKALVPEGWQVIWLAAGPAGPGQYLLDPYGQMVSYVEGGNAFPSSHGLGFSPYGAAAMPSTPSSAVASSPAPFFGSFPNSFNGGAISTPQRGISHVIPLDANAPDAHSDPKPPSPAHKGDYKKLGDLLTESLQINNKNNAKTRDILKELKGVIKTTGETLDTVVDKQKKMEQKMEDGHKEQQQMKAEQQQMKADIAELQKRREDP